MVATVRVGGSRERDKGGKEVERREVKKKWRALKMDALVTLFIF